MHICFITHEYPSKGRKTGGIGVFVQTLGKALTANGHIVSVIGSYTTNNQIEYQDDKINIYDIPKPKIPFLKWWQYKNNLVKTIHKINTKTPIDILEGAESSFAFLPKFKDIKKVIRLHGGHSFFTSCANDKINWRKKYIEQLSINKCDGIIGVTNYVLQTTGKLLNFGKAKTTIITHPIDTDLFKPIPHILEIPYSLTFAGTNCKKKGLYELCQAIEILYKKYPNLKLWIVGKDSKHHNDLSYQQFLKNTFLPKLNRNIQFIGAINQHELKTFYAKAQICIFPSHMETQGLVAPEAMAMKKLVIFSNTGPGPETITHKKNGLLCNPHNPSDIAKQIEWVFNNQSHINDIKNKAYQSAIKKFNCSRAVKENLKFYQSLL